MVSQGKQCYFGKSLKFSRISFHSSIDKGAGRIRSGRDIEEAGQHVRVWVVL